MLSFKTSFRIRNLGIKVKRKFFYGLLLGLLMFCIIPVTIANLLSSYYYTNKIVKKYEAENIENLNSVMLNNSRIMQEFKTLIGYATDSDTSYFSSYAFYDDIIRYDKLIDKLSSYLSSSEYIDSIYLYSQKFDYVTAVSTRGNAFLRDIISEKVDETASCFENGWLEAFQKKQYFKVLYRNNYLEDRACLSYIIPTVGREKDAAAALIINVQFSEIIGKTNQVLNDHNKNIYMIIDNSIVPVIESSRLNPDDVNKLTDTKDSDTQSDNTSEKMIINKVHDPYMDITYLSVVPKKVLTQDLESILTTYYIIMISFTILFIIIAWVYTMFLYKPLEQLLKIVSTENAGDYTNTKIGEFQIVLSEYKSLISTKNLMKAKLEANKIIFRERFLNSLLKGQIHENIENKTLEYEIDIKGKEYLVILIYIEHQFGSTINEWGNWQKVKELIQNAVNVQLEQKNIKGALCSIENGEIAVIISQNKNITDGFIQSFVESLIQSTGNHVDAEAHISISQNIGELNNISEGYTQAQQALRLGMLNKKSKIHYYTDLPDQHNQRIEYKSTLNVFVGVLKDYNEEKLESFIENIMDNAQKEFDYHHKAQAYYIKIIVNIMDYIENMTSIDCQSNLAEFCQNLIKCRINSEVKNVLNIVLKDIAQKWMQVKENMSAVDRNVNNTIAYIHQYYNKSIGLKMVAGHVGLNHSYLSRIFKRATSMSFQDYLAKVRVEKACTLLIESDMQIYNIGSSVGFGSTLTFNRTFKKIEGCSPKEYRENHSK